MQLSRYTKIALIFVDSQSCVKDRSANQHMQVNRLLLSFVQLAYFYELGWSELTSIVRVGFYRLDALYLLLNMQCHCHSTKQMLHICYNVLSPTLWDLPFAAASHVSVTASSHWW